MACSISVILYNKFVFNTLNFPFPVFLTTWHLAFSVSNSLLNARMGLTFEAISTRILQRTTTLVDGAKEIEMTVRQQA